MQSVCSLLPSGALEFAEHSWHTLYVAPINVEYVSVMHFVHKAGPDAILYLPATHSTHTPPFGPVDPALQMQSVCSLLASGAFERGVHA
jgi:hypothetical protein